MLFPSKEFHIHKAICLYGGKLEPWNQRNFQYIASLLALCMKNRFLDFYQNFKKPSAQWLYFNTSTKEAECGGKITALPLMWTSRGWVFVSEENWNDRSQFEDTSRFQGGLELAQWAVKTIFRRCIRKIEVVQMDGTVPPSIRLSMVRLGREQNKQQMKHDCRILPCFHHKMR